MKYTDDQKAAIEQRDHSILVAAAAGSGKTRVLVDRIVQQLQNREFDVDELLVVTFTKAAAAEMRQRLEKGLREALAAAADEKERAYLERQIVLLGGAHISTMHSFCNRIIAAHAELTDMDSRTRLVRDNEGALLKRETLENLLEQHYAAAQADPEAAENQAFLDFVDSYGDAEGDEDVYQIILSLYEFAMNQPAPREWLAAQRASYSSDDAPTRWLALYLDNISRQVRDIATDYAGLHMVLPREAGPDLHQMWEPYRSVIEQDIESIEQVAGSIQTAADQVRKASAEDLEAACAALSKLTPTYQKLKADHKPLKEQYPELRKEFDSRRTALKKKYKDKVQAKLDLSPAGLKHSFAVTAELIGTYTSLTAEFIDAYSQVKRERGLHDFNDLEQRTLDILCADRSGLIEQPPRYERTETAREIAAGFKSIMLDEYQDTNGVQEAIVNLINRPDNVFQVGDVKQSIYGFRHAEPRLFLEKYNSYPLEPGEHDVQQLITMRQNFRSRACVLGPINKIFDQIMTRSAVDIEYDAQNKLYAGFEYPEPPAGVKTLAGPAELAIVTNELVHVAEKENGEEEPVARTGKKASHGELENLYIVQRIQELMRGGYAVYDPDSPLSQDGYRSLQYRDIVILQRKRDPELLEALRTASIPAYASSDTGYFEAQEIQTMMSLLYIIDNARQDIPLAAVLLSPIGGFTSSELAEIKVAAGQAAQPAAADDEQSVAVTDDSFFQLIEEFAEQSSAADSAQDDLRERVCGFLGRLAGWRDYAGRHSVPELLWNLYRETGYYDYVGGLPSGLLRQANLRMLIDKAAEYEETSFSGLFHFLRYIDTMQKRNTDLGAARTLSEGEDVVRIMTIHASKGLEFAVVILAGMGKQFPYISKSPKEIYPVHQKLGIGASVSVSTAGVRQKFHTITWQVVHDALDRDSLAEEERLLYVALTRAREKIIMVGSVKGADDDAEEGSRGRKASLRKKMGEWCQNVAMSQVQLPDASIGKAKCMLDWVAMAAARDTGGHELRELGGAGESAAAAAIDEMEPDGDILVQVIDPSGIADSGTDAAEDEWLDRIMHREKLPESSASDNIRRILDWQYDDHGLTTAKTKVTVTELKRQVSGEDNPDTQMPSTLLMPPAEEAAHMTPAGDSEHHIEAADFARPAFLQEDRKRLTGAERGTLMHSVMQHIDLAGDLSTAGLQQQIAGLEQSSVLLPGEDRVINVPAIAAFFASELGQRLLRARRIWRELPFSQLLPAAEFFPDVQDQSARTFLQGVIDVLFEDEQGQLVLVDYKTDRRTDDGTMRRRYGKQIQLYAAAVESITGREVAERYIYMFSTGRVLAFPRTHVLDDTGK